MKRILFSFFAVCIVLLVMFNLACKNCDEVDARGTWEITLTGLNGDSTDTYSFSGSQTRGILSGGYSQIGTGIYIVEGENISITYDSNLVGGVVYNFTGHFADQNEMKGTGIAYQVVSPESPWEREFDWQAKRK